MPDRTIVITGASDGIGAAAARALARRGEQVVVVGRSPDKTEAVAREIGAPFHLADFARLDDVRALATTLRAQYPRIDVLANNAGGLMGERALTVDGHERTLQVNHLAPFLLTHELMGTLVASRASVITTSSVAARLFGHLDLDDLENERGYSARKAYGDSKLANILFTVELQRRFGDRGVSAAAFHPGVVATGFASDTTDAMRFLYHTPLRHLLTVGPDKGADTLVWLATRRPGPDWEPGRFYDKRRVARTNPQASQPALAAGLWERSAAMVGVDLGPAPDRRARGTHVEG
ncbi:SDR family NAD(P)-dependent oxidoreductase [Cellulomonas sp. ATA003]|uniref:SDR family NAD(P)-dependent oxidoreductase n=1 Tax=Cellulomonas sp. ATA003 TaxID=3073064 RepID=UPI0028734E4C|nr:SDR family NAD(P)-dependent oxidoreductase [Cellulomonas sp. ATA003]WNB86630.1 SDR family NAD(P)-dependent oxidoreductase [Cellulomonas sp. ATA003]